jgi:hypothetical protein
MRAARSAQFTLVPFAQLLIGLAGMAARRVMLLGATGAYFDPADSVAYGWGTRGVGARGYGRSFRCAKHYRGEAAVDRSYLLLNLGFFTCGFHVAFIATHLPGIVATCELPAASRRVVARDHRHCSTSPAAFGSEEPSRNGRMKLAPRGHLRRARRAIIVIFFYSAERPRSRSLPIFPRASASTYPLDRAAHDVVSSRSFAAREYMATLFGIVMLSQSGRRLPRCVARGQGVRGDRQL